MHFEETTFLALNTSCEDMAANITSTPEGMMYEGPHEVFVSAGEPSFFYPSLLSLCETFLNAVSQSAVLTATPIFITEVLYRLGGHERQAAERFGQDMQTLLVVSFSTSPEALSASLLASWLASRFIQSPARSSAVGLGVGMTAGVISQFLTSNAHWGWLALQAGTALLGSAVGSVSMHQLPAAGRWGFNQASNVTAYLGSKLSMWSSVSHADSKPNDPDVKQVLAIYQ